MIVIADNEVTAGQPVWIDVCTTDPAGVLEYYTGLFGWTFDSYPDPGGQYTLALSGGVPVAGLREPAPGDVEGWMPYLASPDVVETAAEVRRLGGSVPGDPVAIPFCGRRLLAIDPAGATIGFWQAGSQWQSRLYEPGALWWAELNLPCTASGTASTVMVDTGAVDSFYAELFGYQHKTFGDGGYQVWMLDGTPYLGRLPAGAGRATGRAAAPAGAGLAAGWWAVYLVVPAGSTVEGIADRSVQLGGTVPVAPFDHSHGRATVLADPTGAEFTVLEVRKPAGSGGER